MIKKIICFGVILVMIFSLMGCNQGNKLEEYKASANTTIETYAQEKGQDNYTVENWAIIERLVAEGKMAVDAAADKSGVDAAATVAKQAINAVLTKEEEMDEALENRIKQDYLQEFGRGFWFDRFYGLYSGAAVFFIPGDDTAIKTAIISGVEFSYSHGWTILVWKDGSFYDLEDIENIFDAGILTQNDIERIGAIHVVANNENRYWK